LYLEKIKKIMMAFLFFISPIEKGAKNGTPYMHIHRRFFLSLVSSSPFVARDLFGFADLAAAETYAWQF